MPTDIDTAGQRNDANHTPTDTVLPIYRSNSYPPEGVLPIPIITQPGNTTRPIATANRSPHSLELNDSGIESQDLGRTSGSPASARRRGWRMVQQVIRTFFTAEGRELRHMAGILFRLIFGLTQVVVIVVILALAGTTLRSKADPKISEFDDCAKLGIWNALWAVRAAFGVGLIVWEWKRSAAKRRRAHDRRRTDVELGNLNVTGPSDHNMEWGDEVRGPSYPPGTANGTTHPMPTPNLPSSPPIAELAPELPTVQPQSPLGHTNNPSAPRQRQPSRRESREPSGTGDGFFDRLDTLLTAAGLLHFILNHVWLYTTVHTCRRSDPHIWYLGLGIAGLGYLIVLELLLIAFIVFVLGPILLLILNLVMLCLGRPFDRQGNVIVRAEIPPIEQKDVDKIPLVVYVSPQEISPNVAESHSANEPGSNDWSNSNKKADPMGSKSVGKPSSSSPTATTGRTRPRFAWRWKRSKKGKADKPTMWSDANLVTEGDPRYETCDHPFVVLESNRADCPICLNAFVEPKRRAGVPPAAPRPKTPEPVPETPTGDSESHVVSGEDITLSKGKETTQDSNVGESEADGEVGIPGEPLRLLACGHVFHKNCLDPWLLKTSGRCPVCNCKVEIPENMK